MHLLVVIFTCGSWQSEGKNICMVPSSKQLMLCLSMRVVKNGVWESTLLADVHNVLTVESPLAWLVQPGPFCHSFTLFIQTLSLGAWAQDAVGNGIHYHRHNFWSLVRVWHKGFWAVVQQTSSKKFVLVQMTDWIVRRLKNCILYWIAFVYGTK